MTEFEYQILNLDNKYSQSIEFWKHFMIDNLARFDI